MNKNIGKFMLLFTLNVNLNVLASYGPSTEPLLGAKRKIKGTDLCTTPVSKKN